MNFATRLYKEHIFNLSIDLSPLKHIPLYDYGKGEHSGDFGSIRVKSGGCAGVQLGEGGKRIKKMYHVATAAFFVECQNPQFRKPSLAFGCVEHVSG